MEHGVCSAQHEDKKGRSCRAPIVGDAAARPWLRVGVPPPMVVAWGEATGDVGSEGRRGVYVEGGR